MSVYLKRVLYIVLVMLTCLGGQAIAQRPVRMGPASPEDIKKAREVLDANFDSLKAHRAYIYAMGLINPQLAEQYRKWVKQYPKKLVVPLSIGKAFYGAEMPQAKEFLLKAAEIEPKNPAIWSMLSADAFTRGEYGLSTEYRKNAMLADTSNADYAFAYVSAFEDGDPAVYKQKVFDFIKRFPHNDDGAYALCRLGEQAPNPDEKIKYFKMLIKMYPPQRSGWSANGMAHLTDIYLQTDPVQALALINEMGNGKDWILRKQIAEALIQANKLEQKQDYKAAANQLDGLKLPRNNDISDFMLLKKAMLLDKAGDTNTAYYSLAAKFAKDPTDAFYAAMELYGQKTNKNGKQISKDIDAIRHISAVTAAPFDLGLYTSDGKLKLSDLKGKVVLLTFWFPACGPCRAEFPHFQAVINKFKAKDVVYLGISIAPEEDPFVLPLLEKTKFSFIPLRGTREFAKNDYGVDSEPTNFLIDKNGKIVFKNFRIDGTNHRTLELMISALLGESKQGN